MKWALSLMSAGLAYLLLHDQHIIYISATSADKHSSILGSLREDRSEILADGETDTELDGENQDDGEYFEDEEEEYEDEEYEEDDDEEDEYEDEEDEHEQLYQAGFADGYEQGELHAMAEFVQHHKHGAKCMEKANEFGMLLQAIDTSLDDSIRQEVAFQMLQRMMEMSVELSVEFYGRTSDVWHEVLHDTMLAGPGFDSATRFCQILLEHHDEKEL
eukprot:gnl/TRDRNA2_/TRDRNA2_80610_c0_seq1.p1 gnl/TRDRNA2_/TRDRNA2_80610_c0~~gnl/TRDRNA2_/TRDRNA2_80610_c0_seq1.p1  ORF type:complete len:217 (+),score=56.76 gnl/TRDRNA2_/TRDRNA2_80610_c0_seq1:83-733(+)